MPVKKMEMKEGMHHHSKPMLVLHGLIAIAIGVWAWMLEPSIVQIIAVLLVLMGLKKLLWAAKCCC